MTKLHNNILPINIPTTDGRAFPVRRLYCVGRNYADHVAEMGGNPKTSAPLFFTKSRETIVQNGALIPFPTKTENLHYEGELVVALGQGNAIFGYGCGLDMTRRDLQAAAKDGGKAWDMAKNFDHSAPIGALTPASEIDLTDATVETRLNSKVVQSAPLSHMIWSVENIITSLSGFVTLAPGDIILTGTPAGVGPVQPGDEISVSVTGLDTLSVSYATSTP